MNAKNRKTCGVMDTKTQQLVTKLRCQIAKDYNCTNLIGYNTINIPRILLVFTISLIVLYPEPRNLISLFRYINILT